MNEMPQDLRVSLWNLFLDLYDNREEKYWQMIAVHVAKFFRKFPADDLPIRNGDCRDWLREYFFSLSWHQAYNFVEFMVERHGVATRKRIGGENFYHPWTREKIEGAMNFVLERENAGYRFVAHVLSPITDDVESNEVQKAATELAQFGLEGARKHIQTAIELFSKRPNPDYRNAVKEAISAIESIAKQLGGKQSDGLTPALRALQEKAGLHGALRSAFEKLYGYTSDEGGVRHAMLEESTVDFEEAKYMIVACSAFANYLATKAEKSGLLRRTI